MRFSLLVAALAALSPLASAASWKVGGPIADAGLARRDEPQFEKRLNALERRQRATAIANARAAARAQAATARASARQAAAAARAAAASGGRSRGTNPPGRGTGTGAADTSDETTYTLSSYEPGSAFTLATTPGVTRCFSSRTCQNALESSIPDNAQAVCNTATYRCQIGCIDGYAPGVDSNGNAVCIANVDECDGVACPTVQNGISICQSGSCAVLCDSAGGYTLVDGACVNLQSDVNNCGSAGNVCPGSPSGLGDAKCYFGNCTLVCPLGTERQSTGDEAVPFTCAPNCPAGTSPYDVDGEIECLNLATDTRNCGAVGNLCDVSYNGVGSVQCVDSQCTLNCPAGTTLQPSGDANQPLLCA